MAAGLINKTVGDGNSGTFSATMLSDTGLAGGNLRPATTLYTSGGTEIDFTASSPVFPSGRNYETVAASQTDQAMGATGATGDVLDGVLIIPATTSPGAVSIKDGSGSAITIFTGGATSVSNLVPFFVPIGATSGSGAWKVTTGANVSAIGFGKFT